ncbi:MAG: MBOAT family O-acyltransferase, partial [Oscillospiraceae bacterium]
MLFTTLQFIGFLALCTVLYYTLPHRFQWLVLLFASIIFYMGIGRRRIIFILASALTTYVAANLIEKINACEKERLLKGKDSLDKAEKNIIKKGYRFKKRIVLIIFLAFNLGGLSFFKFYNFAQTSGSFLPKLNLIMPVGISFYTLQIIGYVCDVYNKKVTAEKNLLKTVLFTTYFPQIIQGPINRFGDLQSQLTKSHIFDYDKFVLGLMRMLWGYFKKLVIADRFAVIVTTLFQNSANYAGFEIAIVIFFYTIQLYADFSGGIDIAMGASELFGIELPENFKTPFFSKSIGEFWRRWHITLGAYLRDYVFYPVTLSKPMAKLGKWLNKNCGKWFGRWIPAYISLFILWFCSGLWHGEGLQFIAYGLYHGTLIMLGMTFEPIFKKAFSALKVDPQSKTWQLFQVARTFSLVCIGELIFRSSSVSQAVLMMKSMFSCWNPWV